MQRLSSAPSVTAHLHASHACLRYTARLPTLGSHPSIFSPTVGIVRGQRCYCASWCHYLAITATATLETCMKEGNLLQLAGKSVKVMVAESKIPSRSCGGLREDELRTRSCTPSDHWRIDGRLDGSNSAQSWHGCTHAPQPAHPMHQLPPQAPATLDALDCNPLFWAWLHSQGVHSLDSLSSVQNLHNEWQLQGCPGPILSGNSGMVRSLPGGHNSALSLPRSRTASPGFQAHQCRSSFELVRKSVRK
jgi:hypothetical protein